MERSIERTKDGEDYRENTRWRGVKRKQRMERRIERTHDEDEYRENTGWKGL